MNYYLLDTNIWIALAKKDLSVISRLKNRKPGQILSCAIVRAELLFGARKSQQVERNLMGFQNMLRPFVSLPFDDQCAEYYGIVRATLERAGTPIGGNDLLVASIALAHDCTLVTRNNSEFARVAGLRLEVW